MQSSVNPSVGASTSHNKHNPIDLTLDEEEEDSCNSDRKLKRTCTLSRHFNANNCPSSASSSFTPYHSGLSPAMSSSSLHTDYNQSGHLNDPNNSYRTPSSSQQPRYMTNSSPPPFNGPSSSSAFFPRSQPSNSASISAINPARPPITPPTLPPSQSMSNASARQIIDLTNSPSPPPTQSSSQSMSGPLPDELPPKTPVCIGQLTVTALVLYPIGYLQPIPTGCLDSEWAPIRLSYEHNANKPGAQETIHIRTPNTSTSTGQNVPGENFGVVEQKVATILGPMLGKGLIRLDGRVRRGQPNLPILPLQLLVFTPKGNIPVVSNYLYQNGLFLDHPCLQSDILRLSKQYYCNPHNPPPGGFCRNTYPSMSKVGYSGPGGSSSGRWSAPVSGKSVEVQRSQVDELFKSLRDGDELLETDPPPEVATTLYPHQKKALTFLLEREREFQGPDGKFSSLWQERHDQLTGRRSWFHIVTQREVFDQPNEAKGAILADDMGLGKTITCVALIAATLSSAQQFVATPDPLPQRLPETQSQEPPLTASQFSGSVWGMPEPHPEHMSAKAKAKATREHDRQEAEYIRACRIKSKSRATLIICPLSTVVNWEDQFKEHWKGEVTVVGGASGISCLTAATSSSTIPSASSSAWSSQQHIPLLSMTPSLLDVKEDAKVDVACPKTRIRDGRPLKVYVYHGNSRRPDPAFLSDFDAVITTYATLATEYSKQMKSVTSGDDDDDGGASSDGIIEVDERGNQIVKLPKPKKTGVKKRKKGVSACPLGTELSSPLQSVHWFRVVLDEAHCIKETTTVACRACCDLIADRRLCLTGTPVQNKLDDVYALVKFLRLEPFDDKAIWTEFIGTPVKYAQPLGVARLQTIMKCITLRRTKESKAENGERILSLPPRRDELRYLQFDEQEKRIYDEYFNESKAEFKELSNRNEVMKNYVGILQKILRLRQICDHYELVMNKGDSNGTSQVPSNYEELTEIIGREGLNAARAQAIFTLLREAGTAQCVECTFELGCPSDSAQTDGCNVDEGTAKRGRKPKASAPVSRTSTRQNSPAPIHPILTRCQHLFCLHCFRSSCCPGWPNVPPDVKRCCSVCQACLLPSDAVEINPDYAMPDTTFKKKLAKKEKRVKGKGPENYHPSTKIKALLNDLIHFSRSNPNSANYDPSSIEFQMVDKDGNSLDDGVVKTVVFSQWTSMLDKIEDALEQAGIRYDRLDGTMKRDDRTRAMDALKYDPGCEVLLVSLKAGGVGLNLTAAQRVYLMDPYWNPAVENQAVDRIHRLGQTKPVTTIKLIIENSIEARLLEVQKKKTELANMTLGQNFTKAEMLQRRLEELNQLFGS
ncbi:P-loop containing nucleoside triphosphate hydrolase protein [Abortiporus biennis]|nr:P-loop containing nucleoside triphosphate hydrolase protein [Abortiporus biennis]